MVGVEICIETVASLEAIVRYNKQMEEEIGVQEEQENQKEKQDGLINADADTYKNYDNNDNIESTSSINNKITSIELCSSLIEGGVTPSVGLIKIVRAKLPKSIFFNVLIRPRAGDFLYTNEELNIIEHDINVCKEIGVDGIVFGALTKDGDIDENILKRIMRTVYPLKFTFHRAFDLCCDPISAFKILIDHKVNRVLTSGQSITALAGIELIRELVSISKTYEHSIVIAVGGGVDASNAKILSNVGVHELHGSLRTLTDSEMKYKLHDVFMGGERINTKNVEYEIKYTSIEKIRELFKAII